MYCFLIQRQRRKAIADHNYKHALNMDKSFQVKLSSDQKNYNPQQIEWVLLLSGPVALLVLLKLVGRKDFILTLP